MDKTKVIVGMLIMIALTGLPCCAWRHRGLMMGLPYIYGGKEHEKN